MNAALFVAAAILAVAARLYFGVIADRFVRSLPVAERERLLAAIRTATD